MSLIIPVFAENSEFTAGAVFINSNPVNAGIILDGKPVLETTPALFTNLTAGKHTVGFRKEGFADEQLSFEIVEGETEVIKAELVRGTVIADFPDEKAIILRKQNNSKNDVYPGNSFRIPEGKLNLRKEGGKLIISPIYPKQQLFTLNTAFFFTALGTGLTAAGIELHNEGELFPPHSIPLIVAESVTALAGITELALLIDRKIYYDSYSLYPADLNQLESEAKRYYEDAQNLLSRGRLEDALSGFTYLVSNYSDSPLFSSALYRISKIHILSGDTNLALSELNIIIDQFPDAEIYDKACQTLALLYYNQSQPDKAVEIVNRMVFYDPLFTESREDLADSGALKILENWLGTNEGGN